MVTFHQTFWDHLSTSRAVLLMVVASFSTQLGLLAPVVFAQTDTVGNAQKIQTTSPPSPRLDSDLQYFGSRGRAKIT